MKTELIILGCGNSMGTPRIDGYWGKCNKNNKKNIRTRCSAVIIKGTNSILIDTSPDLKMQLLNNKIKDIRIAYGGMAPIPKRAIYCEKILSNSLVTDEIINKAKEALEKDFKPITDMRASRSYRMEVAKNLLEKCCAEIKQKKLIGLHV